MASSVITLGDMRCRCRVVQSLRSARASAHRAAVGALTCPARVCRREADRSFSRPYDAARRTTAEAACALVFDGQRAPIRTLRATSDIVIIITRVTGRSFPGAVIRHRAFDAKAVRGVVGDDQEERFGRIRVEFGLQRAFSRLTSITKRFSTWYAHLPNDFNDPVHIIRFGQEAGSVR
jgi:hypothetical protein